MKQWHLSITHSSHPVAILQISTPCAHNLLTYHTGAIDVDTGLSVAVAPPDLPPVELGDAEDAAQQLAAAAGVAALEAAGAAEGGAGIAGLPPLLNNPAQGFNLPELIIPAKWLARFVS